VRLFQLIFIPKQQHAFKVSTLQNKAHAHIPIWRNFSGTRAQAFANSHDNFVAICGCSGSCTTSLQRMRSEQHTTVTSQIYRLCVQRKLRQARELPIPGKIGQWFAATVILKLHVKTAQKPVLVLYRVLGGPLQGPSCPLQGTRRSFTGFQVPTSFCNAGKLPVNFECW